MGKTFHETNSHGAPRIIRRRVISPSKPTSATKPIKPRITDAASLLAAVDEISASVPASEWARVPRDGSRRVDHYLYGRRNRR